jgi:hypothetical protein
MKKRVDKNDKGEPVKHCRLKFRTQLSPYFKFQALLDLIPQKEERENCVAWDDIDIHQQQL